MVTTQARRPSRAAWRAKAADVVVLPTPPEPQQITIDRSRTSSSMVLGPVASPDPSLAGAGLFIRHVRRIGQGLDAGGQGPAQVVELARADGCR